MVEARRKYPELAVQRTPNLYLIPNLQYQQTHSKLGFERTRFPRQSEGERPCCPEYSSRWCLALAPLPAAFALENTAPTVSQDSSRLRPMRVWRD